MPCSLVHVHWQFAAQYCFHLQGPRVWQANQLKEASRATSRLLLICVPFPTCWWLVWFTIHSCRRRQYVPPKFRYIGSWLQPSNRSNPKGILFLVKLRRVTNYAFWTVLLVICTLLVIIRETQISILMKSVSIIIFHCKMAITVYNGKRIIIKIMSDVY
jgi:hypothetical protein